MDRNSFLIGLLVGVVIYFLFTKLVRPQVSEYTIQPFDNMTDREAVKASAGTQTAAIVAEMISALTTAKNENKTVDERVEISNRYTDQLCQVNKSFAEWSLRHSA